MKTPKEFFRQDDVVTVAKGLLGKYLFTQLNGRVTAGMIVETEAYSPKERGSHAFGYRRTKRNEQMYSEGGRSYVYLCYGIHHMFNVVTNVTDVPDAVLIRALEPVEGRSTMMRRLKARTESRLTSGPGKLAKAMGIDLRMNGASLQSKSVWIEEGAPVATKQILMGPRIGIDYAGEDALLPWRFVLKGNIWVSR
ncbi:MAG: DNA-3-methyladenine glycosylase [Bacteroidetes bacterium]|nr:DNA-3-methyladenine glycosylase [Bacteroidota bacterium]